MTEVLVRGTGATTYLDHVDEPLVCVHVEQVTHDVRSITLALPGGAALSFRPGQYVTVTADVDGRETSRCYTIASSPLQAGTLTLTVKRQGPVSTWLHDRLGVGDRLRVSGPMGVFSTHEHPAAAHLLLSAGSGVTPLMSMLRTLVGTPGPHDVVFVHSARTPADIVFRRELEDLAAALPWLRVAVVCEGDSEDEVWRGARGRLTAGMLAELAPDAAGREVFTCGPRPYMDAVRGLLAELGCDPARCHQESFVLDPAGAVLTGEGGDGRGGTPAAEARTHTVTLTRSGREVTCAPGQTILAAAARAGLSLPSSCAEGVCGTCKSQLLAGSVDMRHGGGIRPREIAADKVLLCCSTPLEDCVVEA
ncbi:Flavodoxin reductases (ferredoxin-NADPH reductases) family 1 [Serinicoccus hydrothermalis]|uniref:Flavodoxin reductases (Ferredoxin-NADPH reductases) family 1 n=1 Tax=Serinicoccus hydrothermalis TaxID=1758689 RepID=A0A1B1ND91_9MICO|nr:FAD-binding oxidoreductase [Serinicoccus hydrothermalis]ANS79407.1 Flavodoxin reductases (ferredoxin-NADPH reductases) family 1 [Serinicoccus hydrothermalis]